MDTLLARMRDAAGGAALGHHRTLELTGHRRYLNQGVDAALHVLQRAPGARVEDQVWFAAGRRIGRLTIRCDGTAAGQETTFGQDQVFAGAELEDTRRDALFAWLLDPRAAYPALAVRGRLRRGGDVAYVLAGTPAAGTPVTWLVSSRTYRVIERRRGTVVEAYADFRDVGGCGLPFRTVVTDPLGESEVAITRARFDVPAPERAFRVRPAR